MSSTTSGIQHRADTQFKMNVSIFYDHIANNQSDNFRYKLVMDAVCCNNHVTQDTDTDKTWPGLDSWIQCSSRVLKPSLAVRHAWLGELQILEYCLKLDSADQVGDPHVSGTKDLLKSLIVWTRTRNQWSFLLHLWHYYWVSGRPGSAAAQGCLCRNINFCKVGLFLIVPL